MGLTISNTAPWLTVQPSTEYLQSTALALGSGQALVQMWPTSFILCPLSGPDPAQLHICIARTILRFPSYSQMVPSRLSIRAHFTRTGNSHSTKPTSSHRHIHIFYNRNFDTCPSLTNNLHLQCPSNSKTHRLMVMGEQPRLMIPFYMYIRVCLRRRASEREQQDGLTKVLPVQQTGC